MMINDPIFYIYRVLINNIDKKQAKRYFILNIS